MNSSTAWATVLDRILKQVRVRIEERKALKPLDAWMRAAELAPKPHDWVQTLRQPGTALIAEIKFASPSQGEIRREKNPGAVAQSYLKNGARALSVLTESDFFKGSLGYLSQVRQRFPEARILAKDFFIDPYQIYEARSLGADAVLLMLSVLDPKRASELLALTRQLGMEALLEVHDEEELDIALSLEPKVIGINNRNLKNLKVDLQTSLSLAHRVPQGIVLVSESGIENSKQIQELKQKGFTGFLVGTSLMRSPDPGQALAELLGEKKQ